MSIRPIRQTSLTGVRKIPRLSPIERQQRLDNLQLLAMAGADRFERHNKLQQKFSTLLAISQTPAPDLIAHPKLPQQLSKLEEHLAAQPESTKETIKLEHNILTSLHIIEELHRNHPEKRPATFEEKITRILERIGSPGDIQQVTEAFRFLKQAKFSHIHSRYKAVFENESRDSQKIAGTIAELNAILRLSKNKHLEVVDANLRLNHRKTGNSIEFFDLIARSKIDGKLILFEIKRNNRYGLADFMHQFFGIGANAKGKNRKTVSQIDVLLDPKAFSGLPPDIANDIENGNYEIRVITHKEMHEFNSLYGREYPIDGNNGILPLLEQRSSYIGDAKGTIEVMTRREIEKGIRALRKMISEQRVELAERTIKFLRLGWI